MSDIQEFDLYVDCPHCYAENYETAFFDFSEAGPSKLSSSLMKVENCTECDETFYYVAELSFEVDVQETYKTKPKSK